MAVMGLPGAGEAAQRLSPTEMVDRLNHFYEIATRAVVARDGTVDKLMSDQVIAFFGTPYNDREHALRAVETAADVIVAMEDQWGGTSLVAAAVGPERRSSGTWERAGRAITQPSVASSTRRTNCSDTHGPARLSFYRRRTPRSPPTTPTRPSERSPSRIWTSLLRRVPSPFARRQLLAPAGGRSRRSWSLILLHRPRSRPRSEMPRGVTFSSVTTCACESCSLSMRALRSTRRATGCSRRSRHPCAPCGSPRLRST